MRTLLHSILFLLFSLTGLTIYAQQDLFSAEQINIDYKKFTLNNGLTLLVYEDHKAPIVAVNVWYHVGSKNEKPGKSGFAHLFEHLMFNGSENYNTDYFQALESIGGTDVNGTTNNDRTNYFQNVPVAALDQVLFLESDRMGHLLGVIDQERLDEQRGVVQNEKRQGENQPYGQQYNYITKMMYPEGHPYSWTVIGEMEDLNAASLEDVQQWFRSYYGAANAVIAIAGDVQPEEVYKKVVKYFGDIPSGPTIERQEVNIPYKMDDSYQVYEDRVSESRVLFCWHTPQYGHREDLHFDLIAAILSNGKSARLYKKLVYDEKLASGVFAFQASSEIGSNFYAIANVSQGVKVEQLQLELTKEIEKFIDEGPTEAELRRVKSEYFARFIKGMERIGGFGGVSDILADNETYHGDAGYYKTKLKYVEEATTEDLRNTAKKWLTRGKHILICNPFPEYTTEKSSVDRSALPAVAAAKIAKFPQIERARLSNGMNIVLARREGVPVIDMNLMFDAGFKTDHLSSPGTASLAMNLLDEGTSKMNSLEISEKLQYLGAELSTGSDQDVSTIHLGTLKPSLDASMDLLADVVLNPAFSENEFRRLKQEQLNTISREKSQPVSMVLRSINKYFYGDDHPYGNPFTGTGYEATVKTIDRNDILSFYNTWIRPNNATLVVTGDIDMNTLRSKVENVFGKWKKGNIPEINFAKPKTGTKNTLFIIDRPESQQSFIIAGSVIGKYGDISEIAKEQLVNILGGAFTSRINMNLREDKHWSYGAGGFVLDAKHERPFVVYAPVQTDKTAESIAEIRKELTGIVSSNPPTDKELEKVKSNQVLALSGMWETNTAVNQSLYDLVRYELPDDYYQNYDSNVRNLNLSQVEQTGKQIVHPDQINWFLVGDKSKIIDKLEKMNFDQIIDIDADGNMIKPKNPKTDSSISN